MFFNTLRLAMRSIAANKLRSFLTMLGIIIGCMSVIMLVSIGESATGSVSKSISDMGTDLVTVNIIDSDYALTLDEFMVLEESPSIALAAPVLSSSTAVRRENAYLNITALGVTPDYLEVTGSSLQAGRNLVPSDDLWRSPVAVVGTRVAEALFESYQVVGETVTMGNRSFLIVGLLEETGSSQTDARVLIPMSMAERISDSGEITNCYIKAASAEQAGAAQAAAERYLYTMIGDEDFYDVYNQSALLDTLDDVMSTLSLMLGGISAISLLVGGIGIMNIMLVSVAERTREIGIRKAIGARRADILSQFLVEACVLSLLGGLLGLALSFGGLKAFSLIGDMEIQMEWRAVAAALAFCTVIGIGFGSYPAAKAASLAPIDALQRQ